MRSLADYKQVGYRIKKSDEQHYLEIKDFIINDLGADMCFIQWNLLKAFFNGLTQAPPANDVIELKFLRQNIQLNVGCTINYNRVKARRLPPVYQPDKIKTDEIFRVPLLLEDYELLNDKAKVFWKKAIIEKGIVTAQDFKRQGITKKILNFLSRIKHLLTKWV